MAEDATYQTLVYHERGGEAEVLKSGGIIRGHSGGIMSAESGFIFTLASQNILAKDMARVVHSRHDAVIIGTTEVSTKFSVVNLPSNVRIVTLSTTSTLVNGSFWLTSCSAGAEVYLRFGASNVSNQSTYILVSLSGCLLLGSLGNKLSSFSAYVSASGGGDNRSFAMVHLVAFQEDTWAIINTVGDINEKSFA